MTDQEHLSKYQRKIYEVREFNLGEVTCMRCRSPFYIDLDQCDMSVSEDGDRDVAKYWCPYCGTIHRVVI